MPNSKQIVYLSQAQYAELIANGSITVDGVTVTYDENDIYVTPQAEPVTDVRVNGTSITANGVVNIPVASASDLGTIKIPAHGSSGLYVDNGALKIYSAGSSTIKGASNQYEPIVPYMIGTAAFYGLAKAAGIVTASDNSSVGTYTESAKSAIQSMLGVSDLLASRETSNIASQAYAVGDIFTLNGKLYKVTTAIAENGAIVVQDDGEMVSGANAIQCKLGEETIKDVQVNGTSILQDGVANVPIFSSSTYGVVMVDTVYGITKSTNGKLQIYAAPDADIKSGTSYYRVIVPVNQHKAAFYGLAKAAGDTTQSQSSNAVGTYTDEAKAAIRTMLGAIGSENYATSSVAGVVKLGNGITASSGTLVLANPTDNDYKTGGTNIKAVVPSQQHKSVFYGLAKAAGDTTQSASSNAVGTYTDNAKASIKSMLGIVDGSTSTVSVTGTTPSITAVENTRYTCGEVSTLTITPPASGICIVRFTSGTTPTVLTATGVVWPAWFDATDLEADTTYEICITDGYGAVMLWPL